MSDVQDKSENGRPLIGTKVMVTRAAAQAQKIYEKLEELGAEVLPYPTIEIEEHIDPKGWDAFKNIKSENRWLIFTSESGVKYFIKQFREHFSDLKTLDDFKIASIGKASAARLQKFDLKTDFISQQATADAMGLEMKKNLELAEAEIVRIRGALAADIIEKRLAETGANIIPLTVYNTFYPQWPGELKEKLFANRPDVIIFSSGSTVNGLFKNLSKEEVEALTSKADIYSIGPTTSKVLKEFDIKVMVEANPHNINNLIKRMVDHSRKH